MFSASNKKYCNEVWVRVYYPTLKQSFSGYYPVPSLISDIRSFGYNPTKKEIDELWGKEAELRVQEIKTGKVKTIPGEDVFKEIQDKLSS